MECTQLRDRSRSLSSGIKKVQRCHGTGDVRNYHRWACVAQLPKLSSLFGGRSKHVINALRKHCLKGRGSNIDEEKRRLRSSTPICIESSLLVEIFHPTRIYHMPRFVTMRAKGAVVDFAPLGTLNNFRHLKRSASSLPLIVWDSVSFELKRFIIKHVLHNKTRYQVHKN